MNKSFKKISILSISFMIFIVNLFAIEKKTFNTLEKSEINLIDKFIENTSIKDSVGQLLIVGAAGDYNNFNNNPNLKKQIQDLGVGGIILNKYNYNYKKKEKIDIDSVNSMISFHNNLQSLSLKSSLKLPLFLAVDLEGPAFTSLNNGITIPPPALTLGSTQDKKLIRDSGKMVGFQLNKLGINMLLGPVLDVDRSMVGEEDHTIRNRSFGGTPDRVYTAASHFTTGVREAGTLVIGKHFPGLGSVQGSMHSIKKLPTYFGGSNRLKDEIAPYINFTNYLDGVMTSHVYLDFIEKDKQKPVTFSKTFVTDLLQEENEVTIGDIKIKGLGYKNRLIISDDMSDMGTVINYRKEYSKTFTDIAIEALDAGHDLLVFSHLELKKIQKRGTHQQFEMSHLEQMITDMADRISKNDSLKKKFKHSLKKIIKAKALINKRQGGNTKELLKGYPKNWVKNNIQRLSDYQAPTFLKANGYKNSKDLVKQVLRKATIKLSQTDEGKENFVDFNSNYTVDFYIDEKYLSLFKSTFSNKFKLSNFYPICRTFNTEYCKKYKGNHKKKKWLEDTKKLMSKSLNSINVKNVVYTALTPDDIVIFDNSRLKNDPLGKVIMFIHSNPNIIKKELIPRMNIYGSFTKHPLSYDIDIEVLEGRTELKSIDSLPINFGKNINNLEKRKYISSPAQGFSPLPYYATYKEKELYNEVERLKNIIKELKKPKKKNTESNSIYQAIFIIIFIILLIIFIILLFKSFSHFGNTLSHIGKEFKEKSLKEYHSILYNAFIKEPKFVIYIILLAIVIIVLIIFFYLSLVSFVATEFDRTQDIYIQIVKSINDYIAVKIEKII